MRRLPLVVALFVCLAMVRPVEIATITFESPIAPMYWARLQALGPLATRYGTSAPTAWPVFTTQGSLPTQGRKGGMHDRRGEESL